MGNPYLVLYNAVLAAGWSYVLFLTLARLRPGSVAGAVDAVPQWVPFGHGLVSVTGEGLAAQWCWLKLFQTLAVMEILHAMLGLVSSKVSLTVQQVFSRLVLVWAVVHLFPELAHHVAFTYMVVAWSISEITRYSWYALKDLGGAPFALTWCRYTFFIVLYPVGVTSELALLREAIHAALASGQAAGQSNFFQALAFSYVVVGSVMMLAYLPLFPGLYLHMLAQRKKTLSPKPAAPAREEAGILFPRNAAGERSTSTFGQYAFAASVAGVSMEAAAAVLRERNWRFGYAKHVVHNVELCCRSRAACVAVCEAGLAYLHAHFDFVRDGKAQPLHQAMAAITASFPSHATVQGAGPRAPALVVPYRAKPYPAKCELQPLSGDVLLQQLERWVQRGTIEPSARAAIERVAKGGPQYLDLSGRYFVLLGAGAAMGPLEVLLQFGAHVVALDLDRKPIWQRLIGLARKSPGTITFPLKTKLPAGASDDELAEHAGANLFTQAPEIANWLCDLFPDKELTVGGYAYLDGELHVRVAIAMDAIMNECCKRRKVKPSLAFLCSPTDVFVCPPEARAAMQQHRRSLPLALKLASVLKFFGKNFMVNNAGKAIKADSGEELFVVDGLVVPQGPNYALAKRLQHWRAMLAWSQGFRVSTNIAPSTATLSVVHNKQFAAAYGGFKFFPPMEVSYQETSNSLMGALLVHDIVNPQSKAAPTAENPVKLFASGACHFGIWRQAFKIGSIGEAATLLFYAQQYGLLLGLGLLGSVGAAAAAMVLA